MTAMRLTAMVVLGGSLVANALLLRALRITPTEESSADTAGASASPGGPAGASGARAPAPAVCDQRITAAQEHLAREEEALRAYLPLDQLFARGLPHPEAERRLHPILGRLFGTEPGVRTHGLECKDVACKLVLVEPADTGDEAWDQAINADGELQEWTRDARLARTVPIADPARLRARVERTIYFKLDGPRAVALAQAQGG